MPRSRSAGFGIRASSLATVFAVVAILGCAADFGPDHTVRSASLVFEGSVLSLSESRKLTPLFLNASGDVIENVSGVTWRSSDPAVAAVDHDGSIRGLALGGPVTITVTAHGHSASATIAVVPDRVVFAQNVSSLVIGHTVQLAGTPVDFNGVPISTAAAPVRWSSGDASIATVNETSGLVTAIAPGDVFIYATSAGRVDGLYIETGDPSVYDGSWSGSSVCPNCTYPTVYPITFDIVFGRVKRFQMTVTGPPPFVQCGAGGEPRLVFPPTGSPNAVVRDDQFAFTLIPDLVRVTGTFLSHTTMSGMHSGMTIPVVCVNNQLPVPPLTIAPADFSATRQ